MAKRGAKGKYTPELVQKLCDYLAAGNYIETSCALVGIATETYYAWKEKFHEFSDAVEKARASAEAASVMRIRKAGVGGEVVSVEEVIRPDGTKEKHTKYSTGQWQADAWFLERSYPDRWGRQRQDINISFDKMSNDDLIKYITEGKATGNSGS